MNPTATDVLAHALSRPATLGAGRLVCVDGPSGSGKTTLAEQVRVLGGAEVVHLDDLYPGWDGLLDVGAAVLDLLRPLAENRTGSYVRWDWTAGRYAETLYVEPAPLLVLEGVASGSRAWEPWITTLVWVEAPAETRLARSVARDGEEARQHLLAWAEDETVLFAREDTRARADLVVDTAPE